MSLTTTRIPVEGTPRFVELWTIDRPTKLNAIDSGVLDALDAAIRAASADPQLAAVVLTGSGDKAFAAGADIAAMAELTAIEAERFSERGQRVLDGLARLPMPVIAAVNGVALGGGCELAMACDLILAGPRARFGQPEVRLGVIPGFGGTQRLVRRVGWSAALDLCLTGRQISAEEALRMGLCSRVVEGDVAAEATAVARDLATLGPVAVRLCKRAIHENADESLSAAQAAERTLFGLCFATADQGEGMAAFLGRRPAQFSGR
jgi:enoyl-CoA hydratase